VNIFEIKTVFFPDLRWPGNKVNERKISVFRAQFKFELRRIYTQHRAQQDVIHESFNVYQLNTFQHYKKHIPFYSYNPSTYQTLFDRQPRTRHSRQANAIGIVKWCSIIHSHRQNEFLFLRTIEHAVSGRLPSHFSLSARFMACLPLNWSIYAISA